MTNFTVLTDEQAAALQAENARLRAFVMEAIDMMSLSNAQRDRWLGKLAALGETNEG